MPRRQPISKLRGGRSFRRTPGQKPPRSITLIVCEGETEQEYFEAARIQYGLTTAEVILADNTRGSAPISVVECAVQKYGERGGYERIYCIFDRDGHESFPRARDLIKSLSSRRRNPLPIAEAVSIPCFEVWILLHFERTDAPFARCADVIDRIRERHMPGYEKADAATARQLMAKMEVAIGNAGWLDDRAGNNDYNPYTSVQQVLRHFEAVAAQGANR